MKYIDAERLKAEIERLLAKAKNDEEKAFAKKDAAGHLAAVTKTAVCVKIKKLIATLQQEQLLRKSPISWIEETKKELQHEEELLDMRLEALKRIREKKNQFKQEQPTKGYDENYLNEKIAKAKKSWEGVDVDKYMDEVRGREQEQPQVADASKMEQPEIDFEDKFAKFLERKDAELGAKSWSEEDLRELALYFYGLGNNARKEE